MMMWRRVLGVAGAALAGAGAAMGGLPAVDGDFSDWPAGVTVSGDGDDVRLLVSMPRARTLSQTDRTVALRLDLDGDAGTGSSFGDLRGVDVSVLFSPPYRDRVGNGVAAVVHGESGETRVSPSAAGVVMAPTFASERVEIVLSRSIVMPGGEVVSFENAGRVRWWLTPLDSRGRAEGLWSAGSGDLVAGSSMPLSDATLPGKGGGAVRIGSMNVLWASPLSNPGPFARVMSAADADIWLFQEWDIRENDQPRLPTAVTEEWLETNVTPRSDWTVIAAEERGVLVASRLPLVPAGPTGIKAMAVGDRRAMIERSVRYVPAIAETPAGKLLVASLHLKCCGGHGTEEDRARIAESVAVSEALHEARRRSGAEGVVVGGDFNLVGSSLPLAIVRSGLDPAGGDLVETGAQVLGDDTRYTWVGGESRFVSGILDYVLTSPGTHRVTGAWVLDTARLSDASLEAMGLERGDSSATDHRPIVLDLVRAD